MCGVLGIKIKNPVLNARATEIARSALLRLQHRGQDAAGMTVLPREGRFESLRGLGHVDVALKEWPHLPESIALVAHTRYATTGLGGVAEVQPFVKGAPRLAMAHNGNIVNTSELKERHSLICDSESDLEVLQQFFLRFELELGFAETIERLHKDFVGSYAVVGLTEEGELFGFRDPYGIRPLFIYESENIVVLASETSALNFLKDFEVEAELGKTGTLREVEPGAWVRVSPDGSVEEKRTQFSADKSERFCMFELVYFSSPQSEFAGLSTYRHRFSMGRQLGIEILSELPTQKNEDAPFDYVVPVPETSRAAAIAVAETLRVPYREYLVKNPYASRTFILSTQARRLKALETKLSLIGPEVKGQRILLVDDSVVRGNTSRLMAKRLKEAGATSVSLASACPPIRHGCYYGIDFPDAEELVAAQAGSNIGIAKSLGVANVFYLSIAGLKKALGTGDLCSACLDGDYPSAGPSFDRFLSERRAQRGEALRV
ncbi:MAG: amidophosphoribosyltransferase [Bdellovibrionota bacterium]